MKNIPVIVERFLKKNAQALDSENNENILLS